MEKNSEWIDIGQVETGKETARAIEVCFTTGYGIITDHWKWIPKSCYRTISNGPFDIQQVKRWFFYKEKLYQFV